MSCLAYNYLAFPAQLPLLLSVNAMKALNFFTGVDLEQSLEQLSKHVSFATRREVLVLRRFLIALK